MPTPRDPTMKQCRDNWWKWLRVSGFRYFVLRIDDMLEALSPRDAMTLSRLLDKYNEHRGKKGKPTRSYWVVHRDWKCGPLVKSLIEQEFNIKLD
jgi:hypothetical protein